MTDYSRITAVIISILSLFALVTLLTMMFHYQITDRKQKMLKDSHNRTIGPVSEGLYVLLAREGISIFLRIGATAFAFGSIILDILRLMQPLYNKEFIDCNGAVETILELTFEVLDIVVVLLQTFYIFKYHKSVIIRWRPLIRFMYCHLLGANIYRWCYTVVYEALELFDSAKENYDHHGKLKIADHNNTHLNSTHATCSHGLKTIASRAQPYLFPCIIEYSLIAASAFLLMYLNVRSQEQLEHRERRMQRIRDGKLRADNWQLHRISLPNGTVIRGTEEEPSFQRTATDDEQAGDVSVSSQTTQVENTDNSNDVIMRGKCDKAHVGLFLGLFLFALCTVNVIAQYLFLDIKRTDSMKETIFHTCYVAIYTIAITILIYLLIKITRSFKYLYDIEVSMKMDQLLIYLCVLGDLFYTIFVHVSVIDSLVTGYRPQTNALHMVRQILRACSVYLQAMFVITGLQLRSRRVKHIERKPGRTLLTVLIFLNLVLWLDDSLRLKYTALHPVFIHYIGVYAWCLISSLGMPLIIFFRFHSAACLTHVWTKVYTFPETYRS